jgi:hypothetical protein
LVSFLYFSFARRLTIFLWNGRRHLTTHQPWRCWDDLTIRAFEQILDPLFSGFSLV